MAERFTKRYDNYKEWKADIERLCVLNTCPMAGEEVFNYGAAYMADPQATPWDVSQLFLLFKD